MENDDRTSRNPYDLDATIALDFEPRCPIMLLLDVSNSMEGEPHEQLQDGLQSFANYLREDTLSKRRVEVGVIAFGDTYLEQWEFVQAQTWEPPALTLRGTTPMGEALRAGLRAIEERIQEFAQDGRPFYRPWIFLMTDGAPTDEWMSAAEQIKEAEAARRINFFAVGVNDADMDILDRLSNRSAKKLAGLNFGGLFKWVSQGLIAVSHSGTGDNPKMPVDDWSDANLP